MKNHVVCPPPQNQNAMAKPSECWQYPPPPFFEDFGGIFTSFVPMLRPVGTTTSLGSVRRLPTRSAAPVSLDRPPLSPRLSACWTQCDDHLLRNHMWKRCGQGERRQLMHLTRSGLAPGSPSWWKSSSVFLTTFVWFFLEKEGILGPKVFFIKKAQRSSFQQYISFTLHDSWTARS